MRLDQEFAASLIDGSGDPLWSSSKVLGKRLRKFSLWHRMVLKAIDSPFITGMPVTLWDIRVMTGVCRLRFQDSRIRHPWLRPVLIHLSSIHIPLWPSKKNRDKCRIASKAALRGAVANEVGKILRYCGDYLQRPEYVIIPPKLSKGATPPTARGKGPDELEHAGELITWGVGERRAWEMPIGLANFYLMIARREAGHDVDVVTDDEKEFQAQLPPEYRRSNG